MTFVMLCLIIAVILLGAAVGRPLGWVAILLAVLALVATLSPHLIR